MKIEGLVKVEVNTSTFTFNNCTYKERVDTQHFFESMGQGWRGDNMQKDHTLALYVLFSGWHHFNESGVNH